MWEDGVRDAEGGIISHEKGKEGADAHHDAISDPLGENRKTTCCRSHVVMSSGRTGIGCGLYRPSRGSTVGRVETE